MARRPRSHAALAVLLWIALAVGCLTVSAPSVAVASPYFDTVPEPWHSLAPSEELLADSADDPCGDGLTAVPRFGTSGTALSPLIGRDWRGTLSRFLIPFETGPPTA